MSKVCKKTYETPRGDSSTVTPDATSLRFTFHNGKATTVKFTDLPANILEAAMRHGLSQKLGDSYASAQTVEDAEAAFQSMLAQLVGGDWNTRSEGAGANGDLVQAIVRVKKITDEKARESLAKLDDDTVKALKKNPQIVAAIAAIRAERAKAKAKTAQPDRSLDDILGE